MANVLTKLANYTYIPGSPGTPGSAYVPATRGYYEEVTTCSFVQVDPITGIPVGDPTSSYSFGEFTAYVATVCTTTSVWVPPAQAVEAVPATPSTPSQTLIDNNIGWNAGAISKVSLSGDGGFQWKFGVSTTGGVVGFAQANDNVGISDISHGFYYTVETGLKVIEGGSIKSGSVAYADGDWLRVMRVGGQVTYWVNSTKVFTSAYASTGLVYLDVSLYTAGDYIYDPAILPAKSLSSILSASSSVRLSGALRSVKSAAVATVKAGLRNGSNVDLRAANSAGANVTAALKSVLRLTSTVSNAASSVQKARLSTELGVLEFEPLVGIGSQGFYSQANLSMEAAEIIAYSEQLTPQVRGANLVVYPMGMTGYCYSGGVGRGDMSFSGLVMIGTDRSGYGQSTMLMRPVVGRGVSLPGDAVYMFSGVGLSLEVEAHPVEVLVVLNSNMTAAAVMSFSVVVDAVATGGIGFVSVSDAEAILGASIFESLKLLTDAAVFDSSASVYVVNRNLGSTTRYEQFDFARYISVAGFSYGVKADGVYLIGADTDDGEAIRSSIDFGKQDFKTSQHKALMNAYLTLSSSGTLQLRVVDDSGTEYFYSVRDSERHNTVRADLGRGLKANYYELQLYNEGGADFDVSDIEFLVAPLSRRI